MVEREQRKKQEMLEKERIRRLMVRHFTVVCVCVCEREREGGGALR